MRALFQLRARRELGWLELRLSQDFLDSVTQSRHARDLVRQYAIAQLTSLRTLVQRCTLVHVETLGQRLHAVRNQAELSQAELARLSGLKSTRHIGLIEEDERSNPTLETTKGLCRVLGMSLDWFMLGKGEAPTTEEVQAAVAAARDAFETDSAPAAE